MNLHKHQLYLVKQHSESLEMLSAIIRINTEGRSLIMKLREFFKRFKLQISSKFKDFRFQFLKADYII